MKQIKVINKLPRPEPDLEWMKPSKLDNFLEVAVVITCSASWLIVLSLILFS